MKKNKYKTIGYQFRHDLVGTLSPFQKISMIVMLVIVGLTFLLLLCPVV